MRKICQLESINKKYCLKIENHRVSKYNKWNEKFAWRLTAYLNGGGNQQSWIKDYWGQHCTAKRKKKKNRENLTEL